MIARRRFHFRPMLTVFSIIALAILVSLGNWQLKRLEWKRELIAKVEQRVSAEPAAIDEVLERMAAGEDVEYAPVRVSGVYAATGEAKVFGALEGAPGYFLFSPLMRVEVAQNFDPVVYVNRGFVQQGVALPEVDPDQRRQVLKVTGLFRHAEELAPPAVWFRSTEKSPDGLWFVRDPARFAAAEKVPAGSYYVDSFAVDGADWPKGGTTRLNFSNRHFEYALTWFGLAGALMAVWAAASLQKNEDTNHFTK